MPNQATANCCRILPEWNFDTSPTLVGAIARLSELSEEDLRLRVRDVFLQDDRAVQVPIEQWLMNQGIMCKEYLCRIVNRKSVVDGLFLWLLVHACRQHLNVLHPRGIWTSKRSEIMVLTDATITLVVGCFLLSPKMECFSAKDNSFYIKPLHDPHLVQDSFVVMLSTLNKPVTDVQDCLDETGLYVTSPPMLLQEILASLMEYSVVDFHEQICRWLHDNATHVLMIEKWLAVQGISLQDYLQILGRNGSSDGLEVWAASMALNQQVNVVMSDTI